MFSTKTLNCSHKNIVKGHHCLETALLSRWFFCLGFVFFFDANRLLKTFNCAFGNIRVTKSPGSPAVTKSISQSSNYEDLRRGAFFLCLL